MKWFKRKYIYGLILLSVLVSAGLQAMWLSQLFSAQQVQLKQDIEREVSNITKNSIYNSVEFLNSHGAPINRSQIKDLFLSPQWDELRRAFDRLSINGVRTSMWVNLENDSTIVRMKVSLKDAPRDTSGHASTSTDTGLTGTQLARNDSLSLADTKRKVLAALRAMNYSSEVYFKIYSYLDQQQAYTTNLPIGVKVQYTSDRYNYNIQSVYRYQLLLSNINGVVWYRMRYYLASAFLMLLFTCTAFYLIMRLLRNQKLYADAKADFTSNMTHEFKTPIATISVALESIKRYNLIADPETMQNYLDISAHELQRLDAMVEKVLNLNNDELLEQPLKTALYDMQSGLEQVVSSMKLQFLKRESAIRFHSSAEPCFVYGDPVHLTNICYNLIDNAIKYCGNNLTLEISCACDQSNVVVTFKDNGPGIERLYHKKIFERFFRIPVKGDTHDVKGSGLGLHYVKQIVEKHGGTIKVKSEPKNGSSFIITLPAAS